jgi:hypothetical protein
LGWFSSLRRPGHGSLSMIRFLTALLFIVLQIGAAHAVAVRMTPPAGITATSAGYTTASNFTGTFSAASFNSNFTTQVGGKAVTMPATMRMAANAGQFAAAAVRLNPTGMITSAVAAWLLTKGLSWANDQWGKSTNNSPFGKVWYWSGAAPSANSFTSVQQMIDFCSATTGCLRNMGSLYAKSQTASEITICVSSQTWTCQSFLPKADAVPVTVPATEADWAQFDGAALPDAVANDLANKVPLPLQNPEFNPKKVDVPLSDPRIDPVTGKPVQDKARVTPSPDGKSADVQMYTEPLNPDGTPETNPDGTPKPATEKTPEFCELHPDSIICQELDTPEQKDITSNDKTLTITPDSGWGPSTASCPADKVSSLRSGGSVTISYEGACTVATSFRPVVLTFAWLSAILIAIGITRRYG